MTYPPRGIAHVSYAFGGIALPDRNPSDHDNLVREVKTRTQDNGLVQILLEDQRWLVHARHGHPDDCARCRLALNLACYPADDEKAPPVCVDCALRRCSDHDGRR